MTRHSRKRKSAILVIGLLWLPVCVVIAYAELTERPARSVKPTTQSRSFKFIRASGRRKGSIQPLPQSSSRFDLSTSVIAGGGGSSSNDRFKVEGSMGQPAAGSTQTGGSFSMTGGLSAVTQRPVFAPGPNPNDQAGVFVRQHYLDFLNRQPDSSGLAFWTNEITSCGANQQCIEVKRINVSAAFYLSIEFQQTGYLVERIYKAAYSDTAGTSTLGGSHQLAVPIIRLSEFLSDTQEIGQGVVVLQSGWEQVLESNKQAFAAEFVQRTRFTSAFPASMSAADFVDKLNADCGNPLSILERNQLVIDLSTGKKTRAEVLRVVAENPDFNNAEFSRAFVLMQYFGYLRRNPNDPQDSDYTGYDFWLTKLNQFNGNYINAEMVKAFISSTEYRQRFGP